MELNKTNEDDTSLAGWDAILFNNLEWYSFLVNEKQITDKKIKEYFKPLVIQHYEQTFMNHAPQDAINDNTQYPEFKKLYKILRGKQSITHSPPA